MANKNSNNKKGRSSFFLNGEKKRSEYKSRQAANNKSKGVIVVTPSALVLITYILLLVSKFIDVALLNRDNEYMSVIILQMMIFLLPGAIWCMLKGDKYIKGLRISAPKPDSILLIISASLLMITGGLFVGMMFAGLDGLSHSFSLYDTFISAALQNHNQNSTLLDVISLKHTVNSFISMFLSLTRRQSDGRQLNIFATSLKNMMRPPIQFIMAMTNGLQILKTF